MPIINHVFIQDRREKEHAHLSPALYVYKTDIIQVASSKAKAYSKLHWSKFHNVCLH